MKVFKELLPASHYKKCANLLALLFLLQLSNSVYTQSLTSHRVDALISPPDQNLETGTGPEYELGAYDMRLMAQLDERARLLQEAGDHVNASAFFRQALHISRVNAGLYHESQIELLDSLINCEIAQRNWEAVNNHYAHMEHLYRRLYTVEDVRLEAGLQKIVAWHVSAMNVNLDGKRLEHLLKANKLFKLRLRVAELTLAAGDPKFDFLDRSIAVSEHQLYLSSSLNTELRQRQRQRQQQRQRNIGRNSFRANFDR